MDPEKTDNPGPAGDKPTPDNPGSGDKGDKVDLSTTWAEHIPQEYKDEKLWEPIKSKPLGDVLKGYAEAQKLVGGSIKIPGEDAGEEAWRSFYKKLGVPEKASDYGLKKPEKYPEEFWDEGFAGRFSETAHQAGLTPKQLETLMGWYTQEALTGQASAQATRKSAEEELKPEWGGAFERNIALGHRAAQLLAGGEEDAAKWEDPKYGNDPFLVRVFARMGQILAEQGMIDGNVEGVEGPEEAYKQATDIVHNTANPDHKAYWDSQDPRHKDIVDKVQKQFQLRFNNP